jgi:hypothetical protein
MLLSEIHMLHAAQAKGTVQSRWIIGMTVFFSSNAKETSSMTFLELTEAGERFTTMCGQFPSITRRDIQLIQPDAPAAFNSPASRRANSESSRL